jgi:hypothetical protein
MSSIFMSVPRALHFAYLIQAYEAAPESIMARIMRAHVEDCDIWEPRKAKTIDFGGLNALEVRAECAGIRATVERVLDGVDLAVIRARYGLTEYVDEDGERRFFFSRERAKAIENLASLVFVPQYPEEKQTVLDLLVARHFASRKTTPITLRAIADAFGKSHTHYGRIAKRIEEQLIAIENRALDALTPHFTSEKHGHSIA